MTVSIETEQLLEPSTYNSKQLDHLGRGEQIDRLLPQDTSQRKLSLGQLVKAKEPYT